MLMTTQDQMQLQEQLLESKTDNCNRNKSKEHDILIQYGFAKLEPAEILSICKMKITT